MMSIFGLDERAVARALDGAVIRANRVIAPGPGHSRWDRSLCVLLDDHAPEGFVTHSFAGDDWRDCREHVRSVLGLPTWQPGSRQSEHNRKRASVRPPPPPESGDTAATAQYLWTRRRPITGTTAERYLREARGYNGPIPATLGFLPSSGKYEPALIAAFGFAKEIEPGTLHIADSDVRAVHITRLLQDGSGRIDADDAKKIIGRGADGIPIILAPPNDLLGLAIAEGIEDALSIFAGTGLGVWAAGSASRMPALAETVPGYIECVTVVGHDDGGAKHARELVRRLRHRSIDAVLKFLRAPT